MKRWNEPWVFGAVLFALSLCAGVPAAICAGPGAPWQPQQEPPTLDVHRDKEKTVYTIGRSPADTGKEDNQRAWEMLNNMIISPRGAHGKGSDNNR